MEYSSSGYKSVYLHVFQFYAVCYSHGIEDDRAGVFLFTLSYITSIPLSSITCILRYLHIQ